MISPTSHIECDFNFLFAVDEPAQHCVLLMHGWAGCGANTVGSLPQIDNLRVVAGERVASACLPALAATQPQQTPPPRPRAVDGRSMPPENEGDERKSIKNNFVYHYLSLSPFPVDHSLKHLFPLFAKL